MQSFRTQLDERRRGYVLLAAEIERQLREAYERKFRAGLATQSSLAEKLGINRSAVHHRLMGHTNMTIETIADMVWVLGQAISVKIYEPEVKHGSNHSNQIGSLITTAGSSKKPTLISTIPQTAAPKKEKIDI